MGNNMKEQIKVLVPEKELSVFIFKSEKYPDFVCELTIRYIEKTFTIIPHMTDFKNFNSKNHLKQYNIQLEVNNCAIAFAKSELGWGSAL